MRKGIFCLLLVVFSLPLLAQKNGMERSEAQMLDLMNQLMESQKQLFGTFSDSIPMDGFFKFYNFSDVDSLGMASSMEKLQKMMEQQLTMILPKDEGTGMPKPFDFQEFMHMSPDSLDATMKLFEPFLGEGMQQLIPKDLEEQKSDGKKKRKTYSL